MNSSRKFWCAFGIYFKFLPRDTCKKVSKYWLDRAKNEISETNTWKNAEIEANIGGILDTKIIETDEIEACIKEQEVRELKTPPCSCQCNVSQISPNLNSSDTFGQYLDEEIYEMNYCNFRMSAYELAMDLMENRVKTDKGDLYKPTELNYCRDINFHDTKPVSSRLDKILKLAHLDNLNDEEFESIHNILEKFVDVPYMKGDTWHGTDSLQHRIRLSKCQETQHSVQINRYNE